MEQENQLKPLIGILAGMGPRSTGPFIDRLMCKYQLATGAVNDIDFPPAIIYSLPTPFYVGKAIDHEVMKAALITGLQKLESCGAAFIAIPCLTVHQYFDALQESIVTPLIIWWV